MSRLYLRIFLSFWLVIILTLGVVVAINSQLDRALRDDGELRERATRLEAGLVGAANAALDRGGPPALAAWTRQADERLRRMAFHVFDAEGEDLRGDRPTRRVRRVVNHWRHAGGVPDSVPRGLYVRQVNHPVHGHYLIVVARPARPVVLRLLGPLGPWGLIALAIIISGAICFWLARSITRPVLALRHAGQALGQGALDTRIRPAERRDELGDLARDFNRMAARIEALVAAQRQLLRDVSHELRSPLARLQVALALAADAADEPARAPNLARMETEIQRLDHLIGQILSYARLAEGITPQFEPMDLAELMADIADAARLEGAGRKLDIDLQTPPSVPVIADIELLHRAVENVVRNALRHAPDGSKLTLTVSVLPEDDRVRITVSDRGPGVPGHELERMFEPFVRLEDQRGTGGSGGGVGLAIAREAIRRHGGGIRASNRPVGGLTVCLELPRVAGRSAVTH